MPVNGRRGPILMAIYSVMQFLFAPVWGRLTDRISSQEQRTHPFCAE
jgi:MFS family permease